jgi:hypothetical protein
MLKLFDNESKMCRSRKRRETSPEAMSQKTTEQTTRGLKEFIQ